MRPHLAGFSLALVLTAPCLAAQGQAMGSSDRVPVPSTPTPPVQTPAERLIHDLSGPAFLSSDIGRRSIGRWYENAEHQFSSASSGPLFTSQATNDDPQDVESAIISIDMPTYTATSMTFIKNTGTVTSPVFRNYFSTTTNFQTYSSNILSIPTGYIQSADPLMDANVFSSGVAPRRMYTVGIIYQDISCDSSSATCAVPNAIGLWRSDDGGFTWSSPALVDQNGNDEHFLDKPDVAVSWYSGTRGHVYVAYVKFDMGPGSTDTQLFVRRSTNGGLSFGAASLVTTGRVQGPQIVVNPLTGSVFVVWSDYLNNAIKMSFSTASAQSWSTPETAASGNLVEGFLNGNVRANTLPMARYNWVADRLSVVWHEHETSSSSSTTDVYFTARTSTGWLAKKRLNAVQTHDQFMPSIDFDSDGNHMTFYYDRSGHSLNELYQPDWVRTSPSGSRLEGGNITNTFSDPDLYGNRFIGDYQDIWYWSFSDTWGDRFNGAWVKQQPVPGSGDQGDIYVTGIP